MSSLLRRTAVVLLACLLAGGPLAATAANAPLQAEAFLDDALLDPGTGTPLELDGLDSDPLRIAASALDLTGVEPGPHTLYLRFRDSTGLWSAPVGQTLYVTPGNPGGLLPGGDNQVEAAEAFIDVDPGEGQGIPLPIARDGAIDSSAETLGGVVSLEGLGLGAHVLYMRFLDSTGIWSPVTAQTFFVPDLASSPGAEVTLVAAEGSVDGGPAIALAADDGVFDELVETVTLQAPVSASYHSARIRFLDSQGLWGDSAGESPSIPPLGEGGLSGRVTDSETGQPVPNVQVWVTGLYKAFSDANGFYSVRALPAGTLPIATYKSGYLMYSNTVAVSGPVRLDIPLVRDFSNCTAGTVSGVVTDASTDTLMKGITVRLDTGATATTGLISGSYALSSVPAGYRNVSVTVSGYLNYNQKVAVCGNTLHDIGLTSSTIPLGSIFPSGKSADPVNTATGNYIFQRADLRIPGIGLGVAFERSYNSQDPQNGPLGFGWTHSFNAGLTAAADGTVRIRWGDGGTVAFAPDGVGGYTPQFGVFDTLIKNGDGSFTLTKRDRTAYQFDASGRLAAILDKNGNAQSLAYTGGNLTQVEDTAGRAITLSYDASGRITLITDPIGRTVQFTYDTAGDLVSSTNPRGGVTLYTYDGAHQMLSATDPRGNVFVSNTYDAAKRVVASQRDAKGSETLYVYDEVNRKTTITDPLNNVTVHYHDDKMRLIREDDALGNSAFYVYDGAGNRTEVMDNNGNLTHYEYDDRGNVISKKDALGNLTTITYDDHNNPLTRTDALGNLTAFEYDANGNLIRTTDALANVTEITYLPNGLPETVKDPRGSITTNAYDAEGNLIAVTNALGQITRHTYDGVGRRRSTIDALNRTTAFDYDENDNLRTVTDALGKVITHTYDPNDNRESTRDRLGRLTLFAYDEKDLLTTTTDALGNTVVNGYDALDRRTSVKDKRGNSTLYEYDALGRLVKTIDALGRASTFSYDPNGNLLTSTDPLGHVTSFAYDVLDRRVLSRDALGNTTWTTYDALGRVTATKDAKGRTTSLEYDKLGRLIKVTDAQSGTVLYAYDANGNRTRMTDPRGNATTYVYDKLNRPVRTTEPEGNVTRHAYNVVGDLTQLTKPDGTLIKYAYDALHRLIRITYPDTSIVTFTYDANGNRRKVIDALGTQTFVYDTLDRMTSHTDPFGKVVKYGYDANGNRIRLTYPDGKLVKYAYDKLNRLTTVTDWQARLTRYTYDAAGRLTRTTNANGTIAAYGYDDADRLTSLRNRTSTGTVINAYSYVLDEVGNHLSEDRTEPLAPVTPLQVVNDTHDKENRLTISNGVPNTFDANGNLTAKGASTYGYDFENRLVQTNIGGTTTRYRYDGLRQRYTRIRDGVDTRFVLDTNTALTNVLMETDAAGNPIAYNLYGQGLIARILPDGTARQYHYDSRGSTIAITDSAQNTVRQYAYDPFGRVVNTSGTVANPFGFLGRHGVSKYPPAKPGALVCEPLEAANRGR